MTTELQHQEHRVLTAEKIRLAINNNSEADGAPKFSWRLSPSSLGDECVARLWLKFRWTARKQVPGRINRIFQRGNGREDYFTALLRRDGWEVRDYAERLCYHAETDEYITQDWEAVVEHPLDDVHDVPFHIAECHRRDKWKLKQWRMVDFEGHLSGYSDGRARHLVYTNNEWIGVEYKTYNTKRFSALMAAKSVKAVDYTYYVQVVSYLKAFDLPYSLFLAENKNDDDIFTEIIARDDAVAEAKLVTAHSVITSRTMPARFAQTPAHHVCKYCDWVDVCHNKKAPEINCRSCAHSVASLNGKFRCEKWNAVIPGEAEIMAACPQYQSIV